MTKNKSISYPFTKALLILGLSLLVVFIINAKNTKYQSSQEAPVAQKTAYRSCDLPIANDNKKHIKVALLLDTSSSMDGLIEQAKSQLWSIINKLAEAQISGETPELDIALYEYGNDNLNSYNGYIRQVLSFNTDLDDISEKLFALKTNGGNEYCPQVIQTSLNDLDWGSNANDLKLIFIAGNESFQQGPVSIAKSTRLALDKNVIINTIFCGDLEQGIKLNWRDATTLTSGKYLSIDHNSKTEYIDSPYDNEIVEKNSSLNKTYIPYGSKGKTKMESQKVQDYNATSYGRANATKRAVSKSSKFYNNATWDLVDAQKDKAFKYEEIDNSTLPKELKNLSPSELKEYVELKRVERERIQADINTLNVKRKEYVKEQKKLKNETNNLEDVMLETIEIQAKKRGYIFK